MKKYTVRLEAEERQRLEQLVRVGKTAAYRIRHANILLAVDESDEGPKGKDADVAETLSLSVRTVESLRERFVLQGLDAALERKKREHPSVEKILDGEKEAKLIAIACGPKPAGRARWTLTLLADRVVELQIAPACSRETVRRMLKKTN
jgi:Homeodomain-like domain